MKKKILITGASGFVGGFLVKEALNRGYDVHAGVRKTSNRDNLSDKRIRFLEMDLNDAAALTSDLKREKYDYIIQNAGLTKSESEKKLNDVNAHGLNQLVETLIDAQTIPSKFISISSLAAIGPGDFTQNGIVDNNTPPHPVTMYGRSKLLGEQLLKKHSEFPYIIIRPTAVYGPGELDLLTVYKMINSRLELYIGKEKQELTFVYVKDLASVIMDVLSEGKIHAAYFVTDDKAYSSEQFNAIVKSEIKKSTLKLRLPLSLIKIIALISEKISSLSGRYPALNLDKVNELKCKSWKCSISELKRDTGYTPRYDLKAGMAETIKWYKERNIL